MDEHYSAKEIMAKNPLTVEGEEDLVGNIIVNRNIAAVLLDYGYTILKLKTIFEGKKCSANEQLRLNYVLKQMKKVERIKIKDIILFFDSFAPMEKILY